MKDLVFEIVGIDRASATMARVGGAIEANTSKLGAMQRAGQMAGKALVVGLAGVAVGLVAAGKAAAEDQASQAQLAQQLRKAAGASDDQVASTEAWITAQGKATGISDDELRPALARLATATGDVGKAQKLAALAMDVSAGSGKSYQQVTEALAKAQNGNLGALGRLGIATKDASGHTKTLAQIQQDLADKYRGAAAKAADTATGKQKILTTQLHELAEQIGTAVLPAMAAFATKLTEVVGFLSRHTKAVGVTLAVLGSLLATVWAVGAATKAYGAVMAVVSVAQGIHAAAVGVDTAALEGNVIAQKTATVASKAFAAVQWLVNAALDANPIGLVVIAIAALVAGLVLAYKHSETFRNIVNGAFHAVAAVVGTVVSFIRDHWKLLFVIVTGVVGVAVLAIVKHWSDIKAGAHVLISWLGAAWQTVRAYITTPVKAAGDVVSGVWSDIRSGFGAVRDRISDIAGSIRSTLTGAFGAVRSAVSDIVGVFATLIGKVESFINLLKNIPHPSLPHIPGVGRVVGEAGDAAGSVVGHITKRSNAAGGLTARSAGGAAGVGGGDVYNLYFQVPPNADTNAIARTTVAMLKRYKREVEGGRALGLA